MLLPPGVLRLKQDSWILINDPEKLNDDANQEKNRNFKICLKNIFQSEAIWSTYAKIHCIKKSFLILKLFPQKILDGFSVKYFKLLKLFWGD